MNANEAMILLEKNGYFVWDDFLSLPELELILEDYRSLRAEGKFKIAGIGKGNSSQVNNNIRKDETCWLDIHSLNLTQKILCDKLQSFKDELNESFFLGLWSFEGHYSYYPIGGIYQAHLDRSNKDDTRTISMVLYLNKNWVDADGGKLRIHQKDKTLLPIDISPINGRLVCFFSADVLHEVLISNQPRLGFAGWWKRRP